MKASPAPFSFSKLGLKRENLELMLPLLCVPVRRSHFPLVKSELRVAGVQVPCCRSEIKNNWHMVYPHLLFGGIPLWFCNACLRRGKECKNGWMWIRIMYAGNIWQCLDPSSLFFFFTAGGSWTPDSTQRGSPVQMLTIFKPSKQKNKELSCFSVCHFGKLKVNPIQGLRMIHLKVLIYNLATGINHHL